MRELNEECGVMGVVGVSEAACLIHAGLQALQHRGQEGCGIVTHDHTAHAHVHRSLSLVAEAFTSAILAPLVGATGIGHVRYSTQGGKRIENVQPFTFESADCGPLAIAHNGNLTNAARLRSQLSNSGAVFTSTSDTEVIQHLLAEPDGQLLLDKLQRLATTIRGGYSLLVLNKDRLYALRDPHGFRPLVLGRIDRGYVAASETCALDAVGAECIGEVEPGEIVEISPSRIQRNPPRSKTTAAFCSFESIYFARPDSRIFGEEIYEIRKRLGRTLAAECPVDADMVVAIPDSSLPMGLGYAEVTGIPFELGLSRNIYAGRSFIEPTPAIRTAAVQLKLNPVRGLVKGKTIVLIDDSVVRGTTSAKIIAMLRHAGVRAVHFRVASPPVTHSCFFGVDTPNRSDLLAANMTVEEMARHLDADSLAFLSLAGLQRALAQDRPHCFACFTGDYPEKTFVSHLPPAATIYQLSRANQGEVSSRSRYGGSHL